jgi:hypothetical protein
MKLHISDAEITESINRRLLVIDYLSQLSKEECRDLIDEIQEFKEEADDMRAHYTENFVKSVQLIHLPPAASGKWMNYTAEFNIEYKNGCKLRILGYEQWVNTFTDTAPP